MHEILRLEPVDVLHFRGNRLFGEGAGHGESQMPPWPSVFAGALRTRMLVDAGVPFEDFGRGICQDETVRTVLGPGPDRPGDFQIGWVGLHRETFLFPAPADLAFIDTADGLRPFALEPAPLGDDAAGVAGSFALPQAPVLKGAPPGKAESGVWLTAEGYRRHLEGKPVEPGQWLRQAELWQLELRLGIALENGTRTASEGLLYTTDTVALAPDVAFAVEVRGARPLLPADGLVRLGGDGRGAAIAPLAGAVDPPWRHLPQGDRFRMVLSTPGIFPDGWLPPGCRRSRDGMEWRIPGLGARLVAAAVNRHETVSGWDVARRAPKPAVRAVPAGSVYWFERTDGELAALAPLLETGLWPLVGAAGRHGGAGRSAEGFNQVWFGAWQRL